MMDRVVAAQVFVETVERGSATAAADALGMSRAMASRYLGALEEWTGTRLLHRTTRRQSLTSAGERVLQLAREMVRLAADLNAVADERESPQGLLRIAAPTILTEEHLVTLLTDFLRLHPRLSIDLRVSDRPIDLIEDRIDVAVRIGQQLELGYVARSLGSCRSVLCASPRYLAERGTPLQPAELQAHACLAYTNFGAAEWHLRAGVESASVKTSGPFRANEAFALRRAALAGLGIAMLPAFAAKAHLDSGLLRIVLPGWEPLPHPIHALYLSRAHLPAAARTFIDHLAERLLR